MPAAIESATSRNATLLRIADRVGTIEAGKEAGLVVYEGDAVADPGVIGTTPPKYVVQAGRIIRRP